MRGLGAEAFKWTFIIVFIGSFIFTAISRGDLGAALIAALFIALIAGVLVSYGKDKVSGKI